MLLNLFVLKNKHNNLFHSKTPRLTHCIILYVRNSYYRYPSETIYNRLKPEIFTTVFQFSHIVLMFSYTEKTQSLILTVIGHERFLILVETHHFNHAL